MSGIAGIVNFDGMPVARHLLAGMMQSLTLGGPDAQNTRIDGAMGFGQALLRTTFESENERQPLTLDCKISLVADARIDARETLLAELTSCGQAATHDVPDVELIARAYAVWGDRCIEHLLGDFVFAIWDAPRKLLFCARDHMGVKPFYYAHSGAGFVFSNALDCVRRHPSVSDGLNDRAIADFLLFNLNYDQAKTTFAGIDRIPPGHTLTVSAERLQLRRYWTLPIDEPIFYSKESDYAERFLELIQSTVRDRLRTPRVSVLMSGGLDSTTLAASAKRLLTERSKDSGVQAFTEAYFGYDMEREHSKSAADDLGIPIQLQCWDPRKFNSAWFETSCHTPEPIPYPTDVTWNRANYRQLASHSRVAFQGEGPDNALRCEWGPYFSYLLRKRLFGRLINDLYFQTTLHRRLPMPSLPGIFISRLRPEKLEGFPDWLNPAFEKRFELRSRWSELKTQHTAHPVRPSAYDSLVNPLWQAIFERFQPEYTKSALEVRHPYLDIRMLRYMLAVPVLPWCRNKYLLRRSMRGILPAKILARPKTPLTNDPWANHMFGLGLPEVTMTPQLAQYVDENRLFQAPNDLSRFWMDFRVRSLAYWLRNMDLKPP